MTWIARRVLPVPGGPVNVTRRALPTSARTSASLALAPDKAVKWPRQAHITSAWRLDQHLLLPQQRRHSSDATAVFAVVLAFADPELGPNGSRLQAVDVAQHQ